MEENGTELLLSSSNITADYEVYEAPDYSYYYPPYYYELITYTGKLWINAYGPPFLITAAPLGRPIKLLKNDTGNFSAPMP